MILKQGHHTTFYLIVSFLGSGFCKGLQSSDIALKPIGPALHDESESLSLQDVQLVVAPLLQAGNVSKVVEFLSSVPEPLLLEFLNQELARTASPLNAQDKVNLILGMADSYHAHNKDVDKIFDLLSTYKLIDAVPILFVAIKNGYLGIGQPLLAWSSKKAGEHATASIFLNAAKQAVDLEDLDALKKLDALQAFTHALATKIVWRVIDQQKNPELITYLKSKGAKLNAVRQKKYTPLIKATMLGNIDLVRALIQAGVDVNLIPDVAVGSALQIAKENKAHEIIMALRDAGATD